MFYRDTWAEINLDAIKYNLELIKKESNKKIIAVLKANAYGHCDYWVAKKACENGAAMVAVAHLDEALSLRRQGFVNDIIVLGHVREKDLALATAYCITLTVISLEWAQRAVELFPDLSNLKFHLKFDSGMNRLGMRTLDEIIEAQKLISQHNGLVEGIFTHYATADDDNLDYCHMQYERFKSVVTQLPFHLKWIHCENSAATLRFEDEISNAIRVGLIMYGISPVQTTLPFKPSLSLYSCITRIKKIKKGEKVGYGATYTAPEDCFIATLPIGYADGFIRANQGRKVVVNGAEAELVGRICMDQCMICLNEEVAAGTKVEIISTNMPLERVANELATIPYEVLCLLSDRIPRVIIDEGQKVAIVNNRLHEF